MNIYIYIYICRVSNLGDVKWEAPTTETILHTTAGLLRVGVLDPSEVGR